MESKVKIIEEFVAGLKKSFAEETPSTISDEAKELSQAFIKGVDSYKKEYLKEGK